MEQKRTRTTEKNWRVTTKPSVIANCYEDEISSRKIRLFYCGCFRSSLFWPLLHSKSSRRAIEVAEKYADGEATNRDLGLVYQSAYSAQQRGWENEQWTVSERRAARFAYTCTFNDRTLRDMFDYFLLPNPDNDHDTSVLACVLLRDLLGNPFHPVSFDATWRNPNAAAVATAIYADRRFEDMPILGDALEEAGCTDHDVLDHCRGDFEHARGCWVVDSILGRH